MIGLPVGGGIRLVVGASRIVRLDFQGALGEAAVTGGAVLLVVAAVTLLLVVLGLYRMDADEIAAMASGFDITPGVALGDIVSYAATLMTVEAPALIMTLTAVIAGLTGQHTVSAQEVGIMVRCNAFAFMAGVALLDLHFGVFRVGLFFVGVGLLLQAHQSETEHCKYEYKSFHVCPPFLKIVVEGKAPGPVFSVTGIHVVFNPHGSRHIVLDPVLAAEPELAGGLFARNFVALIHVIVDSAGKKQLFGRLIGNLGNAAVKAAAITIAVVEVQGQLQALDGTNAATDLEYVGSGAFEILTAVTGIDGKHFVDGVVDPEDAFQIAADGKDRVDGSGVEGRIALEKFAGQYEVCQREVLDAGQHLAELFSWKIKAGIGVNLERVEHVLFEGSPDLVTGKPVVVELQEIAQLGIRVAVALQIGCHAEGKITGVCGLAVQVEEYVAPSHDRKAQRPDVFQVNLAAVYQGAACGIVDKLAPQPEVNLVEQVGIVAVQIVETAIQSLTALNILR